MRSFNGKNSGDSVHHRMRPSVGEMRAIGIAPVGKSKGGCVSEHRSGFSDIHSVNSSINESGGVAISFPISLKYKSATDVMKFTANLSTKFTFSLCLKRNSIALIYLGATIGRDFS